MTENLVVHEDVIKEAEKDKASPAKATVVLSTNGEAGKWLGDCMGRYDRVEGDVLKYIQQDTVSNITYQMSRQAPLAGRPSPGWGTPGRWWWRESPSSS
jgi:hypothetical protein